MFQTTIVNKHNTKLILQAKTSAMGQKSGNYLVYSMSFYNLGLIPRLSRPGQSEFYFPWLHFLTTNWQVDIHTLDNECRRSDQLAITTV